MNHYEGSCHCGAIRFSYDGAPIERGLRCNCSLCSKKGAMMTSEAIPSDEFTINAEESALGLYQFGAKTAKHYFCKKCGIYTFHETARMPGHFRANIGCIEDFDASGLEADMFDGKHLL
jgi:hypothetical protein